MGYPMPDDIALKAAAYIDSCIASMDRPPSAAMRALAIEKVEKYTRKLAKDFA
jgi:hypothetical protein